jgi:hypothetical protein
MIAYLKHNTGTNGPFLTEKLDVVIKMLPFQKIGLQFTASGYGSKIPTRYMVRYEGKLRRVYCIIYSNVGTLYIGKLSDNLIISSIEGE